MIHQGNNNIALIRAQLIHILCPIPTLQSELCLARAREDTERVRPRSEADMFIHSNVTVMKQKALLVIWLIILRQKIDFQFGSEL